MSDNSKASNCVTSKTTSLIALGQAALGCGIGLLLAERLRRDARKTTGIVLCIAGAASLIAVTTGIVTDLVAGPRSKFGARQRLESIRDDAGMSDDVEIF